VIIVKWIFREVLWEGVDWIRLFQYRDQWWIVVVAVMMLGVP
jgi:hypothetical protein